MRMIGAPEYVDEAWFADHSGRLEHTDELDKVIGGWIGERTSEEVMETSETFEVAAAPIYTIEDIACNPQYLARETFTRVTNGGERTVAIQNVVPLLSDTPGRHRWLGPALGAHDEEILVGELGCTSEQLDRLRSRGRRCVDLDERDAAGFHPTTSEAAIPKETHD